MIVRGFKVVEGDGSLFVAMPSRGFMAEGKQRYYNQVSFSDDEVKKRFQSELLESYERWQENGENERQG
jgi:DNA-binding cell septation regulator SpoVG